MKLEERINIFPINQIKGVVRWDFGTEKKRGPKLTMQEWAFRMKHNIIFQPYVTGDGIYSKRGLRKKLKATNHVIEELVNQGALRQDSEKSNATRKIYTPLSITQTISSISKRAIEEILLKDPKYNKETYGWDEHHHVKVLWSAYLGDKWFEWFKDAQRRKIMQEVLKLPVIHEWQAMPRIALERILQISQKTFQELNNRGLIMAKNSERFKSKSSKNLIHTKALAQFFALLENTRLANKYVPKEKDSRYQDIAAGINNQRLLPYLRKYNLNPRKEYSVKELNEKTGLGESAIRSWAFLMHAFPFTRENYSGKRKRILIRGIDFALYALRKTEKEKQMSASDIARLFAIKESQVKFLCLPPAKNSLYGSQQYVFPLYNTFCSDIRKKYLGEIRSKRALGNF